MPSSDKHRVAGVITEHIKSSPSLAIWHPLSRSTDGVVSKVCMHKIVLPLPHYLLHLLRSMNFEYVLITMLQFYYYKKTLVNYYVRHYLVKEKRKKYFSSKSGHRGRYDDSSNWKQKSGELQRNECYCTDSNLSKCPTVPSEDQRLYTKLIQWEHLLLLLLHFRYGSIKSIALRRQTFRLWQLGLSQLCSVSSILMLTFWRASVMVTSPIIRCEWELMP